MKITGPQITLALTLEQELLGDPVHTGDVQVKGHAPLLSPPHARLCHLKNLLPVIEATEGIMAVRMVSQ